MDDTHDVNKPDIRILDIAHMLQKKILYITGGIDKDGHPLMICDDYDDDADENDSYTDDEFYNTFLYLNYTAKVLWKDFKLVIVINRSNRKWAHVYPILKFLDLISEDEIEHILLLKPQGFMQKHFGKIDLKQIQKCSKHKIIIIDNGVKLEGYIEKVNLLSKFGGCDYFNVNEWVEYTMAVERFQVTCSKVKSRVISTKELFANSSRSSIKEIDKCSKDFLQLVDDIQSEIACTLEIAETLAPLVDKSLGFSHKKQSCLEEFNSLQLKLYTDILKNLGDEMHTEWENQMILLDESKKICYFDEDFNSLTKDLLIMIDTLYSQNDIGNSLNEILKLTTDFEYLKEKIKVLNDESKILTKNIKELIIFFSFYPVDSINTKLAELGSHCENLDSLVLKRKEILEVSSHVFKCLDQIDKWCKSAVDLLVSQPVESMNSKNVANKCLKELDLFIRNKKDINMKNMNMMDSFAKKLGNESIIRKVKDALLRMDEVKVMLEKRETSLKKMIDNVPQSQPNNILATDNLCLDKERDGLHHSDKQVSNSSLNKSSDQSIPSASSYSAKLQPVKTDKKEVKVIQIDVGEKQKRSRLRKSMKMALRRPVSSHFDTVDFKEDPELKRKITLVMDELINTEYVYVNDLRCIVDGYITSFDDIDYIDLACNKSIIFGNIEEIFKFHNFFFLEELKSCKNVPNLVGNVFLNHKDKFNLYADYCKNKAKSEKMRRELATITTFFVDRQRELGHKLNLDSYLLKPVQRITKYQLLLTEILKYVSKKNPAYKNIMQALHTMKKSLKHVNDVLHSTGLIGFPSHMNIDDLGKLILYDSFVMREGKKNALKQLTKLGERNRQVFLFESCIVFSKKEMESNKESGTYLFKDYLLTSEIGVTEVVKGEELAFELWVHQRDELFFLQAENLEIKDLWLTELRKILMTQFHGAKHGATAVAPNVVDIDFGLKKDGILSSNLSIQFSKSEPELDQFYDDDSGWSESEFEAISEEIPEKIIDNNANLLINVNTFKVLADYEGLEDSELSLSAGDLVNLMKEGDEGWWFCRSIETNIEGWVPSSYLASVSVVASDSTVNNKIETSV